MITSCCKIIVRFTTGKLDNPTNASSIFSSTRTGRTCENNQVMTQLVMPSYSTARRDFRCASNQVEALDLADMFLAFRNQQRT